MQTSSSDHSSRVARCCVMTSTITTVCDVNRCALIVTCSQLMFVTSPAVGGHAVLVDDVIDGQRV